MKAGRHMTKEQRNKTGLPPHKWVKICIQCNNVLSGSSCGGMDWCPYCKELVFAHKERVFI